VSLLNLPVPRSTILVVDDNPVNLQVLVRTLDGSGHRILAATDGRASLEIARRAKPDLMLLDVMMPGLDGFEVCRAIKADVDTAETIVIFLSALGEVADKVSGLKLGAVDYITKPIQAEEVLARVESHLSRQYLERELRQSRDRLDRELASAGAMQQRVLPLAMPAHQNVEFAAYYRTSRHAGGDYYDVLELGGDRFGVIVADVSGHGAPAAIVMAMIRTMLHTVQSPEDPPAVLRQLNQHFQYLWDSEIFATAIYGVLDVRRRTLRLSCAGHPRPMLARAESAAVLPVDGVVPLLLMDIQDVPVAEVPLQAADRVLFYTDGISDRESPSGAMYEEERLMAGLARVAGLDPTPMVDALVADLDAFGAGQEPGDDQTLLVVGMSRE
jgi:serine phosphatase RsbU (regulator of sigma subunit)